MDSSNSDLKTSNLLRYIFFYIQKKWFLLPSPRPTALHLRSATLGHQLSPFSCSIQLSIYRLIPSFLPTCPILPNTKISPLLVFSIKLLKRDINSVFTAILAITSQPSTYDCIPLQKNAVVTSGISITRQWIHLSLHPRWPFCSIWHCQWSHFFLFSWFPWYYFLLIPEL